MDQEQREYLGDPRKYAAIAVRTNFDGRLNRGKGFIYVAPHSGDLRMSSPRVVENPWSLGNGGLLQRMIMHELGHVFGLQHGTRLMYEGIADSILTKGMAERVARAPIRYEVAAFRSETIDVCNQYLDFYREFFGISDRHHCLRIAVNRNGFELYSRLGRDEGSWRHVGRAVFEHQSKLMVRKVLLRQVGRDGQKYNLEPQATVVDGGGVYRAFGEGFVRSIGAYIDVTESWNRTVRLSGVYKGKLIQNLLYPPEEAYSPK